MLSHCTRFLTITCLLLWLNGCATYSAGLQPMYNDLKQGNFQASEDKLKQALSPNGADRLLYFLELGVIQHLDGDYAASNQSFEQAERVSEQLETTSIMNQTLAMFSNARQADYAGQMHEKLLINYYKALNYLGLASQASSRNQKLDALDGARVEARRMIIKLNDLNDQLGDYEEAKADSDSSFNKIMKLLSALNGEQFDKNTLIYRDDALAHYLTGLSFEMNGEYDDARISYRKAAESYEQGYAEQFRLGADMTRQAWLDTARMMRFSGGFDDEIKDIAEHKLTAEQRDALQQASPNDAQLMVVEHKGFAPPLEEMNLQMWADPNTRSLKIRPISGGRDAWTWFYMLYADKGVYNIITAYLDAKAGNFPITPFVKTIYLGPLWSTVEDLNLDTAISGFLRVTVPYYKPLPVLGSSNLQIAPVNIANNTQASGPVNSQANARPLQQAQKLTLEKAASPAQMGLQQKLLTSSSEIQQALARSAIKALSVKSIGSSVDSSGLLAFAGGLLTQLTEASETRSWQLLPQDIRIRRMTLAAGEYDLTLTSELETGIRENHNTRMTLKPGQIGLWQVRSMGNTPTTDY